MMLDMAEKPKCEVLPGNSLGVGHRIDFSISDCLNLSDSGTVSHDSCVDLG